MTTDRVTAAIEDEIERLKKVRALLSPFTAASKDSTAMLPGHKRRKHSAAARKRITEAQRKPWAEEGERYQKVSRLCALRTGQRERA
jgi:hypothetical protein